MSDTLLRQYETWECLGDGYPEPWASASKIWVEEGPTGEMGQVEVPRIPDLIREMRGHRCERCGHPYEKGDPRISERGEWSPCDDGCNHGGPTRDTRVEGQWPTVIEMAQWRILTVHHLDGDKANCRWWNLVALCQRCHLRMQRAVIMDRVYHFEHSDWFKPYAAGFYSFKYEGLEITRDQLDEDLGGGTTRLDSLLTWEHKFTQEAIF